MPKQSNWETTRSDTDRSRISETYKMIISWHWGELYLQMALFFCPLYLDMYVQIGDAQMFIGTHMKKKL